MFFVRRPSVGKSRRRKSRHKTMDCSVTNTANRHLTEATRSRSACAIRMPPEVTHSFDELARRKPSHAGTMATAWMWPLSLCALPILTLAGCAGRQHVRAEVIEWLRRAPYLQDRDGYQMSDWIKEAPRSTSFEAELGEVLAHPAHGIDARAPAVALMQFATEASIPVLLQALESKDELVQIHAANALGWLKTTRAIPKFRELVQSGTPGVRANIAAALGDIGTEEALQALESASSAEEWVLKCIVTSRNKLRVRVRGTYDDKSPYENGGF